MTSRTLMNLQTSQTWMKLQVTLLFLVPPPLTKKKRTEGPSQAYKCQASSFRFSFNSKSKKPENVFSAFHLPPLQIFKNLENVLPGEYPFGMQILAFKS